MSTGCPCNLQLLIHPGTLLKADVTRLRPFIVGGDAFQENIETLISYNIRTETPYDSNNVNDPFNRDKSKMECSSIMDTSTSVFYAATGLPALVSTGITILYFFLKLRF